MSKPKRHTFMNWYPADWRTDPRLKMVSLAARGLWADLLTFMHEAEPYGFLVVETVPIRTAEEMVGIVGRPLSEVRRALDELTRFKVFSVVGGELPDDIKALIPDGLAPGTILSRRMLRDKAKADRDRDNGKGGGNPKLKPGGSEEGKPKDPTGGLTPGIKPRSQKPEARDQKPEAKLAKLDDDLAKPEPPDWLANLEAACEIAGLPTNKLVNDTRLISDWSAFGLTPDESLAVVREVLKQPGRNRSAIRGLRYFIPMLKEAAEAKAARPVPNPDQLAMNRDAAVAHFRKLGPVCWPDGFGPKPGEPGCLASPEVLREHGYLETEAVA